MLDPTTGVDRKGESAEPGSFPPSGPALLDDAKSLWQELRSLAHEQLTLVALETRLAGRSLVTMIAGGLAVAILLVSAWLGLMSAVVLSLIELGVAASIALLVVVAANLIFALILYRYVRRQSRYLQFPATLRSLRPVPSELQRSGKS